MTRRAGYSQPAAAHPRVCGENLVVRLRNAFAVGSSPRVRGKPHARGDRTRVRRLIPACAGKTEDSQISTPGGRAHPRACGENDPSLWIRHASTGSSPRVRGKPPWCADWRDSAGLIPARAGKTHPKTGYISSIWAHPRACGENSRTRRATCKPPDSSPRVRGKHEAAAGVVQIPRLIPARAGKTPRFSHPARAVAGSSPRVRGKPGWAPTVPGWRGLIPACAGKTDHGGHELALRRAHPRVCGENTPENGVYLEHLGSSPRVRGKRWSQRATRHGWGLIPARAGKTETREFTAIGVPAHPRACGENDAVETIPATLSGSSPRVRGKQTPDRRRLDAGRLIPARAGKTRARARTCGGGGAHPRVCGENQAVRGLHAEGMGSSPRVRGKHRRGRARLGGRRLIPACAGKTGWT